MQAFKTGSDRMRAQADIDTAEVRRQELNKPKPYDILSATGQYVDTDPVTGKPVARNLTGFQRPDARPTDLQVKQEWATLKQRKATGELLTPDEEATFTRGEIHSARSLKR